MNRIALCKNLLTKSAAVNTISVRAKHYPSQSKYPVIIGKSAVGTPAGYAPVRVELEKGKTYAWCACGLSKKQPFCDGSHNKKNAELKPEDAKFGSLKFITEEPKSALLCMCKKSSTRPFCDGTHETLQKP